MAKTLIVYYSRTGTTKKVAEAIQKQLRCDIEAITSFKKYEGIIGYILAAKEGSQKRASRINPTTKNPADYDLVIIGTPVWAWNITSPVRTYLAQNKNKFKQIAGFCTMGSDGDFKSFAEMEKISGKKLVAKIGIFTKNALKENLDEQLEKFITALTQPKPQEQKPETPVNNQVQNMDTITIDDFAKIQIRVGKILSAERVEGADKLLRLQVSFGEEKRQILAGIAQFYAPEALIGKECPFVYNLAPRTLRGFESQGMILCPSDNESPVLLHPDKEIEPGSLVK